MREIKFRFWDNDEKKIYLQEQLSDSELLGTLYATEIIQGKGNLEIMQYTGLKDKNGKEIYEGDICLLDGSKNPKEMKYHMGGFYLDNIYGGVEAYRMKVIGNIYEDPELLNQENGI